MSKLAAAVIAYNAAEHLPDLLATLKDHVDTIVVGIDHKTTDNTEEVAAQFGAVTFPFNVDDEPKYEHIDGCEGHHPLDWAKARNESFAHVPADCDWVLWIDSDDVLGTSGPLLKDIVAEQPANVGCIWLPYVYHRTDEGNVDTTFSRERVFRRACLPKWADRIHETCALQRQGDHVSESRVFVDHVNYHESYKTRRNLCLLTKMLEEDPTNQRTIQYMGFQHFAEGNYAESKLWFEKYVRDGVDLSPEDRWQSYMYLANSRLLDHDPRGAIQAANAAFSTIPDYAGHYYLLARCYATLGDHKKAIKYHELGLKARIPDDNPALIHNPMDYTFNPLDVIHPSYFFVGNVDKAIECVEKALAIRPGLPSHVRALSFYRSSKESLEAELAALRLTRHLLDTNEVEKAKAVIESIPTGTEEESAALRTSVAEARREIADRLSHTVDDEKYEEAYFTQEIVERERDDVEWFVSRLRGCSRVLHIGSGNGTLVLALAKAGIPAVGVDIDPKRTKAANFKACEAGLMKLVPKPEYSPDPENPLLLPEMNADALAQFHYTVRGAVPTSVSNLGPFDAVITSVVDRDVTVESAFQQAEKHADRILFTLPAGEYRGPRLPVPGVLRSFSRAEAEAMVLRRGILDESHALDSTPATQFRNAFEYHPGDRASFMERPPVAIFCGPTVEPWTPDSIAKGGIGGSETAVIQVAKILQSRGVRVTVYAEAEGVWDGVLYRKWQKFNRSTPLWLFISWRNPDVFDQLGVSAPIRWLWIHDIDHGPRITEANSRAFTGFMAVSDFHRKHLAEKYPFIADRLFVVGNGIDPTRFEGDPDRDLNRVIYASAPDRGLEQLLEYWPRIREINPKANLRLFYGFNTFDKMSGDVAFKKRILSTVAELEPKGVEWRGRISQGDLAAEFKQASVMAYPGPHKFEETYCISAIESQAAGCVPVTRDNGALPETNYMGVVLPNDSPRVRWINAIVEAMSWSRAKRDTMAQWAKAQTWDNVVRRMVLRAAAEDAKMRDEEKRGQTGCAVISIVRDGLTGPHKTLRRFIPEAINRGFEVAVAVDDRTTDGTADWLREQGVVVVDYHAEFDGPEGALKPLLDTVKSVSILWVSDDEEPSDELWERAKRHGLTRERVAYHVKMLGVLDDGRVYGPATEWQARLFPRSDATWSGGWDGNFAFSCHLDFPASEENTKILWHYAVRAPLSEREAKSKRYREMGGGDAHRFVVRYEWEDKPESEFRPLTDDERAALPGVANV